MQEKVSQVNVGKLVRDLADMYPDHSFDVVISELVANSLDANATAVSIDWDNDAKVLVVEDNGDGMNSDQFQEYHDFAAELKTRGTGIGFAGVGAKISFNIAHRVVTETRHNGVVSASDWRWHDDGSLRWRDIPSNRMLTDGTRVEVHFNDDQTPDVDYEYISDVLKRHYLPMFITEFGRSYSAGSIYTTCPQFTVNGLILAPRYLNTYAELTKVDRFQLKSIGWGAIGVSENDSLMGRQGNGILLCTRGKVIKSELFGLSAGILGAKLFGIVEIPELVGYMTTNKCDLKSSPGRYRDLNRLLDPVREKLREFLATQGVAVVEQSRNQLSARLERELTKLVRRLPELQDFDGLLRASPTLRKSDDGKVPTSEIRSPGTGGTNSSPTDTQTNTVNVNGGSSRKEDRKGSVGANPQKSRRNQGPRVAFEEHPGRGETAWLDSNTIIINSGHTAYRQRINQDQARLTYCMFAIGVALDKAELVQSTDGVSYVDKFIAAWGQS